MNLLKKGSKGNDVKYWQQFLNLKVDGIFGAKTEKATKAFQKEHNLDVDGKVGPKTFEVAKSLGFSPKIEVENNNDVVVKPSKSKLVAISAKAPTPLMNEKVASSFEDLRKAVYEESGIDFLAVCGDVFRPADLKSNKDGVAYKSNHKTGRAFDYDQTNNRLIIESEPKGEKQYFRTYIACASQNGSHGEKVIVRDYRGHLFNGYAIDFTKLAEKYGFTRIPAWSGWQSHYNRREFWHYQKMDGLSWEQAMKEIQK